ncbi:SDR family NAD(P)-dependent oxidoreductase [Mycobacterium sp.]|uniref:SDR family NAD(P)-dependent oxidoreductase n=1 Tax=Mycobacterium sp. TaxID=1785 RepID=UPI003BAEBB48
MDIVDRVALVTGAGSGLGRATALALAKAGAQVAVLDRNAGAARSVAEEAGAPAVPVTVDVADRAAVTAAIAEVSGIFGRVDVCVNAAGIPNPGRVFGKSGPLDIEQFQRVIDVNLVGAFDVMRQCAELMTRNTDPGLDGERGVIINVSSGAAFEGQKGQAAYSASKAGLIGLMLPAARDLAQYGIRVVTIAPGLFDTGIFAEVDPKVVQALGSAALNPSRLGDPSEFASLVMHIIENRYLNATTLSIDAGARLPNV